MRALRAGSMPARAAPSKAMVFVASSQFARQILQFTRIVGDLDPVAVREAQNLISADALDLDLFRACECGDSRGDRGIVSRPFERRSARSAALVDLDAVELILQTTIPAGRFGSARVLIHRNGNFRRRESAG
jgi:hypothetical protein